jgi:DNA gyrase subunit A
VRDGLKPVHRRILYSMRTLGLDPDKAHKKSATIVGDVIGKYHPHGDAAVYDSLVRMAQDFNMRYPLVDGHGNFGSIDGDPPAAYRYTEARMDRLAIELLDDLDKDTVDFRPNFDNSLKEPEILPARLPNLLVNGSDGIAVGMATKIPPHNLGEIIDGVIKIIDDPAAMVNDLCRIVRAPDFPTGALIMGTEGAREAYLTGRGSITMRARTTIEEIRKNHEAIIVTEIPFQVNKSRLLEQIAEGVRDKKITGVSDLRDESDRHGMRIVVELQSTARPQVTLNQLFKHSALQQNFGIIMLALVNGSPKVLSLKEILEQYLKHRFDVITRRSRFELNKARRRAHILEGLQIALDHIDEIVEIIRSSGKVEEAKERLMSRFKLSEEQSQAILEMRLSRLTGLERQKLQEEYGQLIKTIAYLEELLSNERRIYQVIREDLLDLKARHGDARRSEIVQERAQTLEMEDLIPEQDMVVTVSHTGYIKRLPVTTYTSQRRGGKGKQGTALKEEDFLEHIFVTTTHHWLLFFTNKARVYRIKVYEIAEASRQAKGTALVNLIDIEQGERITGVLPIRDFEGTENLLMATKKGIAKKTSIQEYQNIPRRGKVALKLRPDDELVGVTMTSGSDEILFITKKGMAIRFPEEDARAIGRIGKGVKGIHLRNDDVVVAMTKIVPGEELLCVTAHGYGKHTELDEYRIQQRGGTGIRTMKITEKTGEMITAKLIGEKDEIIISTAAGNLIRINVKDIPSRSRVTMGVALIRLSEGDSVSAMAIVETEEEEEE